MNFDRRGVIPLPRNSSSWRKLLSKDEFKNVAKSSLSILLTICGSLMGVEQIPNLEENLSPFVLETKKINIPHYSYAFNPSIIRWNGSLLLAFRIIEEDTGLKHKVGFTWLDEEFNPIGIPQVIEILPPDPFLPLIAQDPRLIQIGKTVYMVYNDAHRIHGQITRRMWIAELHFDGVSFSYKKAVNFLNFEGNNSEKQEKNWPPFDYKGELLWAYSIFPHRIMKPNFKTGDSPTIAITRGDIDWKWGELRGGTPALLCRKSEHLQGARDLGEDYRKSRAKGVLSKGRLKTNERYYLAFFHSCYKGMKSTQSNKKKMDHYFMGAYTFQARPPFAVTRISPEPIIGKNFYEGPVHNTWKPLRVVFPGGFIFDDNFIWIVYGRQDHEVWVVKLDRAGLMQSLVPIKIL